MGYLFASIILIAILVANVAFIAWSVYEFRRDWPVTSNAWRKMEAFEKRLLYMGLSLFVFIPALKDHPAADWYIARVVIEILPALAGSFLVAGVLAFMRQMHEVRQQSNA